MSASLSASLSASMSTSLSAALSAALSAVSFGREKIQTRPPQQNAHVGCDRRHRM